MVNRADVIAKAKVLKALIAIAEVDIIINTFVAAFLQGEHKEDSMCYLHGNFNIGGTKSGRLSSSGPNLQNIPSTGSKYAEPVKKSFSAPIGWLNNGS